MSVYAVVYVTVSQSDRSMVLPCSIFSNTDSWSGVSSKSMSRSMSYNLITSIILFINVIIVYLIFVEEGLKIYFLLTILGGSLGNFFDRLYYKAVPDFIDINYNGYHWFIFNVADIFITLGIICLILVELLNYKSSNEKK